MQEISGNITGSGRKVAIVASRFNAHIVENLVAGARDGLVRSGVKDNDITVARCPGAWEIPMLAERLVVSGKFDAVLCLGCIIRGDTPHFDYVAAECSKGIAHVGMKAKIPVVFGVLTTDTVDQAHDRAGLKSGNKGFDAALTALEMADLYTKLP
jgi:6,7-dimethyl-8-ribityllumazine synthase